VMHELFAHSLTSDRFPLFRRWIEEAGQVPAIRDGLVIRNIAHPWAALTALGQPIGPSALVGGGGIAGLLSNHSTADCRIPLHASSRSMNFKYRPMARVSHLVATSPDAERAPRPASLRISSIGGACVDHNRGLISLEVLEVDSSVITPVWIGAPIPSVLRTLQFVGHPVRQPLVCLDRSGAIDTDATSPALIAKGFTVVEAPRPSSAAVDFE
jgi:hypothetical protein